MMINTEFDFTIDTPNYWDNFMGKSNVDPDIYSPTLKNYHRVLWSKPMPNGEMLDLKIGTNNDYLIWQNFRFGSDSITTSFRYKNFSYFINQVIDYMPNYRTFIEDYTRKSYTIGGSIIFPKRWMSINQVRGINQHIKDRFDLTLECIRKFYKGENSPLYETLLKDKSFFDLFIDFKGYVDFFYLNDLVTDNYQNIVCWIGDGNLESSPLPQNIEEYILFIEKELEFVRKRNNRIKSAI